MDNPTPLSLLEQRRHRWRNAVHTWPEGSPGSLAEPEGWPRNRLRRGGVWW